MNGRRRRFAASRAERVEQLWKALSDCPPDAVRWAALGWALAHAERDLADAWQLELAGREAVAAVRPFWKAHDDAMRARATADRRARAGRETT